MSIWFHVLRTFCGGFVAWRGIKTGGFYVGGAKIRGPIVWIAGTIIVIAWALAVAISLDFIPDHVP